MINVNVGGNVFEQPTDLIVIPTNTRGAMGSGLALYAKKCCPKAFESYQKACRDKTHTLDDPILVGDPYHQFLCVATKEHWYHDSNIGNITRAVKGMVTWLNQHPHVLSISVPLLGGGLGNRAGRMDKAEIVDLLIAECQYVEHANVYLCV